MSVCVSINAEVLTEIIHNFIQFHSLACVLFCELLTHAHFGFRELRMQTVGFATFALRSNYNRSQNFTLTNLPYILVLISFETILDLFNYLY